VLRGVRRAALSGNLFLNVSPQFILKRGFDRSRAERFLGDLGIAPDRVVIELTEDYPTFDFPVVHESLMLYRSMGFPHRHRRPGRGIRQPAPVVGIERRVREGRQALRDRHLQRSR
jgi:hypothetical protein